MKYKESIFPYRSKDELEKIAENHLKVYNLSLLTNPSEITITDFIERHLKLELKFLPISKDGKFYPLTLEEGTGTTKTISTQEFEINTQILYYGSTTNVIANSTTANVYSEFPVSTLSYTANQTS